VDRVVSTEVEGGGPLFKIEIAQQDDAEQDVTGLGTILPFDDLTKSVTEVAKAMTDALRRARPDEAEVTFGLDVAVESGKLTSLIVKGSGTATFQVRLLWKDTDPASRDPL
jgi:hypothetical protein